MRDRNVFEKDDSIYFMLERLMHHNVETGKYKNKEQACDAIVASLLLSKLEREENLEQLFERSAELEEIANLLSGKENRNALIKRVAILCKKFVKALPYQVQLATSGLVKRNTSIRQGASVNQSGLSRAVATVLSSDYDPKVYFGDHLLEMNKNERSLFRLLAKIRVLLKQPKIYYMVDDKYSHFSENDAKKILKRFVGDSYIEVTLNSQTLNDNNRTAYEILLQAENELDLMLVEGAGWYDEDLSCITNALKQRKSIKLSCDMVPYGEHDGGYFNRQIIQHLTNVEVKVYDTVSMWKSHGGSWRAVATQYYKKMAKRMDRKCEFHNNGVTFHAVKPKESIHSLFARKILRRGEVTSSVQRKFA